MARAVENRVEIAAPSEVVFDLLTDLRNEPRWNPQMRRAEKTTAAPIGRGTRFRVEFARGMGAAVIQHTSFDRPRSWSSSSRSRLLWVETENHVETLGTGCRLVIRTQVHPRGLLRLATPLLGTWVHRIWQRDLGTVKAQLERTAMIAQGQS